jgi:serine/threonine protein phosphatase PrpC
MKLRYSARTDVGKKREINEDSYGPERLEGQSAQLGHLMVMCDGMGGHAAGEVASSMAVENIIALYYADSRDNRAEALRSAFETANQRIFVQGRGTMGTTGVAALFFENQAFIANVGDSRAYIIHKGHITQISRDHSYVSEQVAAGLLTPEQARNSMVRNIITRALGYQDDVRVDLFAVPLSVNDIILLSSDGMHGAIEDDEIVDIINELPLEEAAQRLIDLSNERGGVDNITVTLAQVEALDSDHSTPSLPPLEQDEAEADTEPDLSAHLSTPPPIEAVNPIAPSEIEHPSRPYSGAPTAKLAPARGATPGERPATRLGLLLAGLVLLLLAGVGFFLVAPEQARSSLDNLGIFPATATATASPSPVPPTATSAPTASPTLLPSQTSTNLVPTPQATINPATSTPDINATITRPEETEGD